MARNHAKENLQLLSRFGILVAQLESLVAAAAHNPPDPLLCFDLLSDLITAIEEEPKEPILQSQRKCEDALYSLLVLGARRPVRHLASVAMAKIILKGDGISIYSRASSLQGFLSDGKKSEAQKVAGAVQCLGELYRYFGRRILSGLLETVNIVAKLLKFSEDFVRQEALHMLRNALEGSDGSATSAVYIEAFRVIMRIGVADRSFSVRLAAARCLKVFANIGGPSLGNGELENCLAYSVKSLEDPVKSVRDAFTEALGALLALAVNPDAQVQRRGKGNAVPKKLEGCLQKYLSTPFTKVDGPHLKEIRVGIALSWVYFLQTLCLKYLHPDSELQSYALQIMDMLRADTFIDAQALACVLYIMRVGITDQMSEPTQRSFSFFLAKQLQSATSTPSMRVAALRTLSYVLRTLGEVPTEFKEVLDDTVVAALSHHMALVRVEAALALRVLAEVDPSCVGGLISYAVTMLSAARENVSFEKGSNFHRELEYLHGQAAVLAALVSISHKLPLGYPSRLPKSMLEVCRNLLMESSRNPVAAAVEKEAGWNLLSSLLTSMPKEELHDQVFDILALWASTFRGSPEQEINRAQDLASEICVWSAAINALTSYVKCFISSDSQDRGILLQPVLLYLNRALTYSSHLAGKEQGGVKSSINIFVIRVLLAYQALSDPSLYRSDHDRIIQICTTPFREASKCDESSSLWMLLDRRDAWLGPWVPGRDLFEDELRSFQGAKDGLLTCVWENTPPRFPQPETISKMLVNQMLLFFGTMFACQDSSGMLSFLGMIDQCLKAGKRQAWHAASVTNICVGLLAGLKSLIAQRPEPIGSEIVAAAQAIFQSILAEGDICASQRRASCEGLGLLARLGNDIYTARLTKQFLVDVIGTVDSNYAGSIALAVGCIHRSAGGMALSSLVPNTVNVISSLAKTSIPSLQIWSLHGLLLTIEAAGLSYVSHVQATLGLVMEIILSEDSDWVELQQAVGRLINAIVAVIGPELAPTSIFFSRCKSAIAEISSCQETGTVLESVRFTQQLVLFAPQAVSVHSHVLTILPTLFSRQPALRHIALTTLRHLIEKDPVSIISEQIEETLFHMLDEETDIEIGNLARATIKRLLFASCPSHPSHWLIICRSMILSTSSRYNTNNNKDMMDDTSTGPYGEKKLNFGEDDENMVSRSKSSPILSLRDKHLRSRTRVFAAECLNQLPEAVGENPAHFDLSLARSRPAKEPISGDCLVLQLQELISLAYQISTIQFEKMRPSGVSLLCTIVDKFAAIPDPELPDHLLLEQYQAQLVSAVRSALDSFSDPILLESGLQLATKILMSGIITRDQVAVKRIFSLISRPLEDFNDLYYPSYAEWVSCKIKVRLLTVHASLKCYMFPFLKRQGDEIPDEYFGLLPLFAKSSSILGKYWLSFLMDYSFVCFNLHLENRKPFIDGISSSTVSVELEPCLEEAWPVILQALVLDAVPLNPDLDESSPAERSKDIPNSGYSMVEMQLEDFKFLWGLLLLILFQEQDLALSRYIIPLSCIKHNINSDFSVDNSYFLSSKLNHEPVFQFVSTERFFKSGFLTSDACEELLQIFLYLVFREDTWDCLAVLFLSKVLQNCPKDFFEADSFACLVAELCLTALFKFLLSNLNSGHASDWEKTVFVALIASLTLLNRLSTQMQLKLLLPFLLIGYKYVGEAPDEGALSKVNDFVKSIVSLLRRDGISELGPGHINHLLSVTGACLNATATLAGDCIHAIHQLDKKSNSRKMLLLKLGLSLEQLFSFANLAFAFEGPGRSQENNPLISRLLHLSIQCAGDVLTDSDRQIQALALQVVRVMLQKGIGAEFSPFLIFYVGELVENLVILIRNITESPSSRETVLVSGECLKIIMLLQTLARGNDCQTDLIHMLLEAILIILSASDGSLSRETCELRELAAQLVSQLAQTPNSAASIKDILLEIPAIQRQRLQDIIRTSVIQDKKPKPSSSSGPSLVIKVPVVTKHIEQRNFLQPDPRKELKDSVEELEEEEEEEEEEDDEEDWDTFQSFPASENETAAVAVAPERTSVSDHGSRGNDYTGKPSSPSPCHKESSSSENNGLCDSASAFHAADCGDLMEAHHSPEDGCTSSQQADKNISCHADEDMLASIPSDEVQELLPEQDILSDKSKKTGMISSDGDDQTSEKVQHTDNKELVGGPADDHQHRISHYNECSTILQPEDFPRDHGEPSVEQSQAVNIRDHSNTIEDDE